MDILYGCFLHLVIINILIGISCYFKKVKSVNHLLVFNLLYVLVYVVTFLPTEYKVLKVFADTKWNWEGKTLSIIVILIFFYLFKRPDRFFLTLNTKNNGRFLILVLLVAVLTNLPLLFSLKLEDFDFEAFIFQLFIPSISEELIFRGALLGLLVNYILDEGISEWFSILLISLLFGLGHALSVGEELNIIFDFSSLFNTSLFGIFWAWLTLKTKSVLYATFSHSMSNIALAFMPS